MKPLRKELFLAHIGGHAHAHGHSHGHGAAKAGFSLGRGLQFGIGLNLLIVVVEVAVGLIAGSLGLLSDAIHNFTDVAALGLAWFGMAQARKPPTSAKTFGYHRTAILTAQINAVVMVMVTGLIFYEAAQRLLSPSPVNGALVLVTATVALVINILTVLILRTGAAGDINIRSAVLHLLGDAATSAGVVISGIIIIATAWYPIDPIISIVLGLAILWGAWQIIKETLEIFLEEAPRAVDVDKLVEEMKQEEGVIDVHDIHVWTIGSELYALSAHVLVDDVMVSESSHILDHLKRMLRSDFGIAHTTLEVEAIHCGTGPYCDIRQHRHQV